MLADTPTVLLAGDPGETLDLVTGWGIAAIALGIVIAVCAAVFKNARKGDVKGTANIALAVLIILPIAAIAIVGGVVAWGDKILGWINWG